MLHKTPIPMVHPLTTHQQMPHHPTQTQTNQPKQPATHCLLGVGQHHTNHNSNPLPIGSGPIHHHQHQPTTHCLVGQCHTTTNTKLPPTAYWEWANATPTNTVTHHTTSKPTNTLPITHNLHPCQPTHQPLHTKTPYTKPPNGNTHLHKT